MTRKNKTIVNISTNKNVTGGRRITKNDRVSSAEVFKDGRSWSDRCHENYAAMIFGEQGYTRVERFDEKEIKRDDNRFAIDDVVRREDGRLVYVQYRYRRLGTVTMPDGKRFNDFTLRYARNNACKKVNVESEIYKLMRNGLPRAESEDADFVLVYTIIDDGKTGEDAVVATITVDLNKLGAAIADGRIVFDDIPDGKKSNNGHYFTRREGEDGVRMFYHPRMNLNVKKEFTYGPDGQRFGSNSSYACFDPRFLKFVDKTMILYSRGFLLSL